MTSNRLVWGLAAAVAVLVAFAGRPAAQSAGVTTLAVPGRANAAPWIASQGRFVAVAWGAQLAGKWDVFVATSDDEGATFRPPVQVNAVAGDGRIGGEIPPRVALHQAAGASRPDVVVAWNAKDRGTEIKVARSTDFGGTFGAPVSLQASGAAGDRGWHSLTVDAQGAAHVVWLDHRGLAAAPAAAGAKTGAMHHGAAEEHDGVAMAMKSRLHYAVVTPQGARDQPIVVIQGITLNQDSILTTLPSNIPVGPTVSALRDHVTALIRPAALCLSSRAPDKGATLVVPHLTGKSADPAETGDKPLFEVDVATGELRVNGRAVEIKYKD